MNQRGLFTDSGCAIPFYPAPSLTPTFHIRIQPDFCDGSFTGYCDLTRQFDPTPDSGIPPYVGPGVDTFIKSFGRTDLLEFMNKFWVSQGSPSKNFWAHEFSKHATCFSTYDTACYTPYFQHAEVINFFDVSSSKCFWARGCVDFLDIECCESL